MATAKPTKSPMRSTSRSRSRSRSPKRALKADEKTSNLKKATDALAELSYKELRGAMYKEGDTFVHFAWIVARISEWMKQNEAEVTSAHLRVHVRKRLVWYDHLHLLDTVGLPGAKIKAHVDAILQNMKIVQDKLCGIHADGSLKRSGISRELSFCGNVIKVAIVTHARDDAQFADAITGQSGGKLSLDELRGKLKMPELP
jgi:hypothetical protein